MNFDEQHAAEELERTRQMLEESRQRRRRANDEFDAFLRGFWRSPGGTAQSPGAQPARRLVREPAPPLRPAAPPAQDTAAAASASPPDSKAAVPLVVSALTGTSPRRARKGRVPAAVAIAAGTVALLTWALRSPGTDAPQEEPPAAVTPPLTSPAPAATPPASATPQPPVDGVNAELRTTRPVWVRVTVDGKPVLERELPADQRLPFSGVRAVVIRAGDAGAVRVSLNGRDLGTLGPDGQVVTRSFSPPE